MKRILAIVLILLLVGCSNGSPGSTATPSPEELLAEEAAVYAALLAGMYPGQSVVLMEQSGTGLGGDADPAAALQSVSTQINGLDPETAASFIVRNDTVYAMSADMDLGVEYSLLSEADMRTLFNINQDGWGMFYIRYPQAPGMTTLSRVGFNTGMDQALVYIGTQSHWLAGAGYYVLLIKMDGTWMIDQQVMTWIS